jgi:ring-1,2-phenylacetyl-CoA epoxidase subunit PaaE
MDRISWKVVDIVKETQDAYRFVLKNEADETINYQAGQFLTFIFKSKNAEIRRSYSISSTPGVDELISITVKRIPNGEVSRYLIDHTQINSTLTSIYPAGRFTIDTVPKKQRQFVFIAAGSGIVPVFSLIKKILHEEPSSNTFLIFQNHSETEIIFKKQLDEIHKRFALQFKWLDLLSKPLSGRHLQQKLNNFLLEKLVDEHIDRKKENLLYLCGPPSFMRMAHFTLKWMGFHDDQIKKENFTIEHTHPPPLISDRSPKEILIHYNKEIFKLRVAYPLSILQAALNENIQLPYSCRAGRCSSCVAKCLKGKVIMSNNEVLTEKDIEDGLVLTCVGYAENDVELAL